MNRLLPLLLLVLAATAWGQGYPPTTGPDNFYCAASNVPINGLNGYDDIAQGPQTCYNTALANTPTPLGYYPVTANSVGMINDILNGTNGATQIQCGQILLVAPGVYPGSVKDRGPVCDASRYIQIETSAYAKMPPEGTRITPCSKGVIWTLNSGYPQWNAGAPCSTNYVASIQADWNSLIPALSELTNGGTPVAYRRWGPGIEFTRNSGAWGYALQPTTATPGALANLGCSGGNCTYQLGVGDGTTHNGLASTSQSLCCSASGVKITAGVPIFVSSGAGANLFRWGGGPVSAVVDDHDFQYTQTYAKSVIGINGQITSITRDPSCNVTGTYSYIYVLHELPHQGLQVFVEGVADDSFNMTGGSVALTSFASTSSTTFSFAYNTGAGRCAASTSSGGGLIAIGSPALAKCPTIPNNNCNGIISDIAHLGAIVGGFFGNGGGFAPGVNHTIFDRVLITGDRWAESDRCLGLGDTDHIAIIDSYVTECHSTRIAGISAEGHAIDGGVANNYDSNAGTYKIVNNFLSAGGIVTIFGGGAEGFKLTQATLTSGSHVTGICAETCKLPTGTTTQFMAGSTLWAGSSGFNGINRNQRVTCCTTTTHPNDTFTFPVAPDVTCSNSCTDTNPNMTIGGYIPRDWEIRRNWYYKPLTWNPLDPTYNGGGPLPSAGMPFTAKNLTEFKNGLNVLYEGNVGTNSWNTVDQLGSSLVLTPKAQGAPSAQTKNIIYRYTRTSDINACWGINNALTDGGVAAYQGNTYVLHDNICAQIGSPTLTCSWTYPPNPGLCSAQHQTADLRSSGSAAYKGTPNFILFNVHLIHNLMLGEVGLTNTLVTGGNGTNPVASYGMVWKDSIIANGSDNVKNAGGAGATKGTVNVTGGTTVTWNSGSQFLCTTVWGAGTFIKINDALDTIAACTDNTHILLKNPAPNGTGLAYFVGGSCNFSCSGADNTPACRINRCWNTPHFDYNIVCGHNANTQAWPGPHTKTLAACPAAGFTNYNNAIPLTTSNWGDQFVLQSNSPGHNAADDGTNVGPNITKLNAYTHNVDTLP